LIDFTGEEGNTKDAFMQGEIVGRLSSMLDYNLDLLVGSKCQELKVKDPKKVNFQPRELLKKILKVYLNLAKKEEFIKAIAGDGRSYRKETFEKAVRISGKFMLFGGPELDVITNLVEEVEKVKLLEAEEEEELGEVPDEYLDPLMATLMTEPVLLPSSKAILDLSTIKSHLLSDPTDPFNRAPLKIQDVIPATELKAAIEAWRLEMKKSKK
jgi:ubiquitin conjugation factor E4 B